MPELSNACYGVFPVTSEIQRDIQVLFIKEELYLQPFLKIIGKPGGDEKSTHRHVPQSYFRIFLVQGSLVDTAVCR
ncbi:hypothetical protein PILCRDRAFT_132298 [Piloderma croceum F 1598]|uniref:Uncharacterized protein n=1 Tax=Piloderma croceum (strain F 1598) TaxID=765440 RepID=A0A0C3GLT7_PILCF|nr:hypothetical protein PILCRDRAFT_132298 [Piloderma croceum F 1598]